MAAALNTQHLGRFRNCPRRPPSHLRLMIMAVAAAALAGCVAGPDFTRPTAPTVKNFIREPLTAPTAGSEAAGDLPQRFILGKDIPRQWWTLFHSPPLNSLVEQALNNSPTLKAAQAALRTARENVSAQQGAYAPTIQGGLSSLRQKNGADLASPLSSGSQLYSLHTAQVNVSYIPDVFGGNRRQVESLQAQAEAQRYLLDAAYISLTSNVVTAALQEASLRGQIAASREMIDVQRQQLELTQKLADLGDLAPLAVAAQQTTLAQSEATLSQLEKQLAQQRDLLFALTGRFPDEAMPEKFELASIQLPRDLPLSLPSEVVDQRPDIRAAEEQLHAASAEIGVAAANMLPQITLSAAAGNVATQIANLFAGGTGFWSLSSGATQTLFQGGTLLHRRRAAEAAYDEAAAQYRSTVINAFQNVADTLYALRADAETLQATLRAEQAAERTVEIARRQVEIGEISRLALLNFELAYQQAVSSRVEAQASRYADTAALFQALGGGWWNAEPGKAGK